jgi:hypothetical protein
MIPKEGSSQHGKSRAASRQLYCEEGISSFIHDTHAPFPRRDIQSDKAGEM